MNKEFGKLSEAEIADLIEIFGHIASSFFVGDRMLPMKASVPPWGRLYELPFEDVVALAVVGLGMSEEILAAARSDNPQQTAIDLAHMDTLDDEIDDAEPWAMPTLIATLINIRSISKFQVPLSEMVSRAANGDLKSMLLAIRLDPLALYAEPIAKIHCDAMIRGDRDLLVRIHRALAGKAPRLPKDELGNVRFSIRLLQEAGAMDTMSVERLRKLVVDRLGLYPVERDTFTAIRTEWRANKKLRGE